MTEMEKALQADGEKLAALTGEDHGPFCPGCLGTGDDGLDSPRGCPECGGTGKFSGSIHDPSAQPGGEYECPCGRGDKPCPGPNGKPLCASV